MNLRKFYKWTNEYFTMLKLARKRGKSWACKHKKRYNWLKVRVKAFDENKILESLDKSTEYD